MNLMTAEQARALAEQLVAKQPAGFHDRLEDPSFKRWLVSDIAIAIIEAFHDGCQYEIGKHHS